MYCSALAVEPTSSLDPIATQRIEELLTESQNRMTIIIVTHNMQQAARVSDSSCASAGPVVVGSHVRLLSQIVPTGAVSTSKPPRG